LYHQRPDGLLRKIGNVHPWLRFDHFENRGSRIVDGFFESVDATGGDVLVSSESFSYFFDCQEISFLINEFRRSFDRIMVIVYIRRQDRLAISHHQQGSRRSAVFATKLYGCRSTALPAYDKSLDQYLDFDRRLGIWADQVGDHNMVIRIYHQDSLRDSDAVSDFFGLLGLQPQHPCSRANVSNGLVKTKVGHLMNQLQYPVSLSNHIAKYLDNTGKMTPSRADAIEFYERYRLSNSRLNERFKINKLPYLFDDDFNEYPKEAEDVWTVRTLNLAIENIAEAISGLVLLAPGEGELLISAAHKLKSDFPGLSDKLFQLGENYIATDKCRLFSRDVFRISDYLREECTEESANDILMGLLNSLRATPILADREIDLVRASAKQLEAIDPSLSEVLKEMILTDRITA